MDKFVKLAIFAGLGYFLYSKFFKGKINPFGLGKVTRNRDELRDAGLLGIGKVTRNRAEIRAMWDRQARIDRARIL